MTTTSIKEEDNKPAVDAGANGVSFKHGNYVMVGWDMDTTGKKPTDEICQIAGYTPDTEYSQYVMPYKDLSRSAKLRCGLKVITITKFRMLKDTKSNKILKTKSEVSALTEFITWLEEIKKKAGDVEGIILVHHEHRQVLPSILFESLKKYDHLYGQFNEIVKGFINSCDVAKEFKEPVNAYSMRGLVRTFFDKTMKEDELINATTRAKLALEITEKLITVFAAEESKDTEKAATVDVFKFITHFANTMKDEEVLHTKLKTIVQRENTLTPIFANMLRSKKERQQATPMRRQLAEAEIEFTDLEQAWKDKKKEGLVNIVNEKFKSATARAQQRILYILEGFFDEENAEQLKIEYEKKPKMLKKKKRDKKLDNNVTIDSGNDSCDNTLTQSPTKTELGETNENQIPIAV